MPHLAAVPARSYRASGSVKGPALSFGKVRDTKRRKRVAGGDASYPIRFPQSRQSRSNKTIKTIKTCARAGRSVPDQVHHVEDLQ